MTREKRSRLWLVKLRFKHLCKNWVQRYNLGYTLDNSFNESVALNDFGITENGNTTYSISLSTDAKFSKNNRFYPSRLY